MATKSLYVVVSAAFQDAGDTTRAIAMSIALKDMCPPHIDLKIDFLSCGSRLEYQIKDAGFNIVPAEPRVAGVSVAEDLGLDFPEFFGSAELVKTFIDGQLKALEELKPDVVFHGMWAPTSIAARLLGITTINFLPLPLHKSSFGGGLIRDLPDMVPLFTRMPRPMRTTMAYWLSPLMLNAPTFRQHRVGAAAAAAGWLVKGPISLFDMNMADLNIVNDHPVFHADYSHKLPDNIVITGPLLPRNNPKLDEEVAAHLNKPGPSIVVTVGSSGPGEKLLEAIKGLSMNKSDQWNVVVLAPLCVCPIAKAKAIVGDDPRFLITDRYVNTRAADAIADVVVTHGGQGTVQTAVAAGTPLVGFGLQIEQQTNLDNVMNAGAGIRIQMQAWTAKSVRNAVRTVIADPTYAANARMLSDTVNKMDGAKTAAQVMWDFLLKKEVPKAKRVDSMDGGEEIVA